MAFVTSGGVAIHFDVYRNGDRPWIVFAHGAGGNAASWWQQVPYFYERYNVLTFDHRAFGRSRCAREQFDANHFAADLATILAEVGIRETTLVCQSMGGRTGLRFALDEPDRVTALVMSHTVGGLVNDVIRRARESTERPAPVEPFGSWAVAHDLPAKNASLSHLYNCIGAFNVDFQSFGRTSGGPSSRPGGVSALAEAAEVAPAELAGFTVPTLFITADHDVVIPPAAIEEAVRQVPRARLVNLGDAGHSSYFEIADRFNEAVQTFLDDLQ